MVFSRQIQTQPRRHQVHSKRTTGEVRGLYEMGQEVVYRALGRFVTLSSRISPQSYLTGWDCQKYKGTDYAPLPQNDRPADLVSLIEQTRQEVTETVTAFKCLVYLGTRFAIKLALFCHYVHNTVIARIVRRFIYNALTVFSAWLQDTLVIMWAMTEAYEQAIRENEPVKAIEPPPSGYLTRSLDYISGSIWPPKEEEKIPEPVKEPPSSLKMISLLPSRVLNKARAVVSGLIAQEEEEEEEEVEEVVEKLVDEPKAGYFNISLLTDNWSLFVPPIAVIMVNNVMKREEKQVPKSYSKKVKAR